MTLQQICVSLELAKQLKAEGYPQESLFTWNVGIESCHPNLVVTNEKGFDRTNRFFHFYAAPTASEIGEQLPKRITASAKLSNSSSRDVPREYMLIMGYNNGKYFLRYRIVEDYLGYTPEINDDSEANARAKMYLYLKIKGLLTSPNQA